MIKNYYLNNKNNINNFIWRSLQIFGRQGTIFLIFIISANILSPEDFGFLNYLMTILALLMIFCDFGVSSAVSKFTAEYKSKDPKKVDQIFFSVFVINIFISICASTLVVLYSEYFTTSESKYILYFLPYLFFVPLTSILDGIYRGLKDFKKLSYITITISIIAILSSYLLINKYLLVGAILSQNLLYFLLSISLFIFKKDNIKFKFDSQLSKKIYKYSVIIGLTTIAYYLYTKADILILGHFGYMKEIGYYEILNKIIRMIIIPFNIIGQVLAPNITKLFSENKYRKVKRKFKKYFALIFPISIVITVLCYFIVPICIDIFLKKYFIEATILMFKILLLILPLKIIGSFISQSHIIATGYAKFTMYSHALAGLINIALDFYFISRFGFIGVVYSSVICYTLATLSFLTLYYFKLIDITKKQK